MSLSHNDAAEELLSKLGFGCEPEPDWVEGRVPDFLCTGSTEFWAEVKGLDEPDQMKLTKKGIDLFRERLHKVQHDGRIDVVVSDDVTGKDVKVALAIAKDVLSRPPGGEVPPEGEFVVIPRDADYGRHVRISVGSGEDTYVLHCCRSLSGTYGKPVFAQEVAWNAVATVREDDGGTTQVPARDLRLYTEDFALAFRLTRRGPGFKVGALTKAGGAYRIGNVEKLRRAAKDANAQFKSACEHRELPCLLMVYQDDLFVSEDPTFLSAFYGDHQVVLEQGRSDEVREQFGPNGFWNEWQNRTTSAACYVRNGATPVLVHNYWAKLPLTRGLLDGVEYWPLEDGTFERTG